ncbi:hypothetical protein F5884DRAFT_97304 [Xylogone sp. PMI_703]|nr:hypothetical protein F5884DRAFT_97304 [Xylogone sp. PMI_703]
MTDNNMSDDSSELSSVPSEDESDLELTRKDGILKFFPKISAKKRVAPKVEASPPRKRSPSPPHEYVLADNPDIAFIVMFRSRFAEAFPKSLAHFGPQELERDIVDTVPGELAEHLLCALLGLLLNRKQDVKAGHYNRALEEAVQTHKSQWAKDWESKNPLSGGATFTTMSPTERLTLLKTLILWSLSSSDAIRAIITNSYKQSRHEDDLNQPLSVQPWGSDSDKRRYYLIEGLDDTHFRVYRESNYTAINRTWFSVAGDIEELKQLAQKLVEKDGGQKAKVLSAKMLAAIPRFEATEEKRKRREYRQARKQQFKRPEHGFSLYEGRTRGKRIKYTYSDDDDELFSDATTSRRSTRNTRAHTPAEGLGGPTVTSSGRQVRSRNGGIYGESLLSGAVTPAISTGDGTSEEPEDKTEEDQNGRPRRNAALNHGSRGWGRKGRRDSEDYNSDMDDDEEDNDASEPDYGDDEDEEDRIAAESEDDDQDNLTDEAEVLDDLNDIVDDDKKSLVVKLPVKTPTPERTSTIRYDMTPEHASQSPQAVASTTNDPNAPQSGEHNVNGTKTSSISSASEDKSLQNTTKGSILSGNTAVASPQLESPSKPISIMQKSSRSVTSTPLSPSLAFRGSPDKNSTFQRSIDVGSRAS